jgi:hypothetical protein
MKITSLHTLCYSLATEPFIIKQQIQRRNKNLNAIHLRPALLYQLVVTPHKNSQQINFKCEHKLHILLKIPLSVIIPFLSLVVALPLNQSFCHYSSVCMNGVSYINGVVRCCSKHFESVRILTECQHNQWYSVQISIPIYKSARALSWIRNLGPNRTEGRA